VFTVSVAHWLGRLCAAKLRAAHYTQRQAPPPPHFPAPLANTPPSFASAGEQRIAYLARGVSKHRGHLEEPVECAFEIQTRQDQAIAHTHGAGEIPGEVRELANTVLNAKVRSDRGGDDDNPKAQRPGAGSRAGGSRVFEGGLFHGTLRGHGKGGGIEPTE